MVRGQPWCKALCPTCKQDCICSCTKCHYCFTKNNGGGGAGYAHIHTCETPTGSNPIVSKTFNLVKLFQSEAYTVTVGTETNMRDFHVHKEALSKASRYFKALFKFNSASEAKTVVLDTEVDNPDAFACFVQFAYMQDYFFSEMGNGQDLLSHAKVYVLAERLEAFELKDLALRRAAPICATLSKQAAEEAKSKMPRDDAEWTVGKVGIRTLPDVIQIIYQNTPSPPNYTTTAEKITVQLSEKPDVITSTRATTTEVKEMAADVAAALQLRSNDRFRVLIARLAASCLDILKRSSSFSECLSECPDFAQDLMKYLASAGPLELDAQGELKG